LKNEIAVLPAKTKLCAIASLLLATACTSFDQPANIEPVDVGGAYQAQYRVPNVTRQNAELLRSETLNEQRCLPYRADDMDRIGKSGVFAAVALRGERLSRNDLVDVRVGDDETFNGSYVISRDGALKLPFLDPIPAQGRSTDEIENDLMQALIANDFYAQPPRISVRVTDFSSVAVGISGAVFEPHRVDVGGVSGNTLDGRRQDALGSSTEGRNLSAALRAAGGVRPDADLSSVEVRRGGMVYNIDMRGVFEGQNVIDVMLLTGDEVYVPSRQCFQQDLMRPSPISPPGVSLFLSNPTQPVVGNASSAIQQSVREVPYGTRYLQAVINTNCVGGPRGTSAERTAALFSRNPLTGVSVVIERDIEDLLRRADRDDYDPYLLPGDAIACYDSTVTNIAEIGRVLGIVGAVSFLR